MTDTLADVSAPTSDEYRLGETLGTGALASVKRVTDGAGTTYAGKVLHASHERDATAVARFLQEAKLLEGLGHENLVGVHGTTFVDGQRVLLMELVEGPTLEQLIAREAPMSEDRIVTLATGIAAGLGHAHGSGIIHRDLKPSNILVAGGRVPKIADFGMARATSLAGVDRNAFTVLGTPDYMAPECLDPLAVDPRTDLYALGCIIYEMAMGRPPFTAATPFGLLEQHRDAAIPRISDSYSPTLRALVESLLSKSPADRPQAAATVSSTLRSLAAGDVALAVHAEAGSGEAICAGCGQRLILQIGVCMNCGLVTAKVEPGAHTLLVVGPGDVGDKLDTALRGRLVAWVQQNPGLRMRPGDLAKRIPRLPFTLATNVSEGSGRAVIVSLEKLGFECELVAGSAWRSPAMRKKGKSLAKRVAGIVAASMAAFAGQLNWTTAIIAPLALLGAIGVTLRRSSKRLTAPGDATVAALPPAVSESLATVERALPGIEQVRHRHGLRAVVGRALQLAERDGADAEIAAELAQSITIATIAAGRLDALDRALSADTLDPSSPEARAMLHERDTWAARLLALTATLDAFQARIVSAQARALDANDEQRLEDLRARVEALEEVQSA